MARDFTKAQRKKLRQLASEAYARELDEELGNLASAFRDWRDEHIDGFQLSELIHEFHQGPSRRLHSQYNGLDAGFLVARALGLRILTEEEVPSSLAKALAPIIEYVRERYEDPE